MLRYDAAWLMQWYCDEPAAAPGVPYAKLAGGAPLHILREPGRGFHLQQVTNIVPRLPYDETVVRLARFTDDTLWVQPCAYSDGVKSNYAMDGPGGLRAILHAEFGARLPPVGDRRLSNGIGTTVIVTDGEGRPYLAAPRTETERISGRLSLHGVGRSGVDRRRAYLRRLLYREHLP